LERVEIRWPSGKKETIPLPAIAIDRIVTVIEGKGLAEK
jgi:hypothetical protein